MSYNLNSFIYLRIDKVNSEILESLEIQRRLGYRDCVPDESKLEEKRNFGALRIHFLVFQPTNTSHLKQKRADLR